MKSVKLDDNVYQNLVENKKKGGYKSISELVRYAMTMLGEVFEEHITERQERQLLRLKLAEIHSLCQSIRADLNEPVKVDFKPVELSAGLRSVMGVDKYRLTNKQLSAEEQEAASARTNEFSQQWDALFDDNPNHKE